MIDEDMTSAAVELDKWLRFAGCNHIGYISVAVGIKNPGDDIGLIIYWDKTRSVSGGMPETFNNIPIVIEKIGAPTPA